jgi:hypothetical protein
MGFTQDGAETSACPVCALCNEVLQNNSVVLFKLKHHFITKPGEHKGKPVSFFPLTYLLHGT